jgi:hypothetical protein
MMFAAALMFKIIHRKHISVGWTVLYHCEIFFSLDESPSLFQLQTLMHLAVNENQLQL